MIFRIVFYSLFFFTAIFAAGFPFIINKNLDDDEKFASAFGMGTIVIFLIAFAGYILRTNSLFLHLIFLGIIIIYAILNSSKIKIHHLRLLLLFFIFFLALIFIQTLLPYYVGGLWAFDWWEHYQRSIFFLDRLPLDYKFETYILPSRPPLFNVVSYFFLSLTNKSFFSYQIIATLLNASVILPSFLFFKKFLDSKKSIMLFTVLASFLFLNPAFSVQSTFTWTKLLSVYFVLSSFYFYLKFKKTKNDLSLILSFVFLGASVVTHYQATIFALAIFLDLFFFVLTRLKQRLTIFPKAILAFCLVLIPWLIFAIISYGPTQTFLSNTTFQGLEKIPSKLKVIKEYNNTINTFLPLIPEFYRQVTQAQSRFIVILADNIFGFYTTSLWGNMTVGLSFIFAIYLLKQTKRKLLEMRNKLKIKFLKNIVIIIIEGQKSAYFFFVGIGIILGILTIPTIEPFGVSHVTLIPVWLLIFVKTIAFVKSYKFSKLFLNILFATILFESILGIGLRLYISNRDLYPKREAEMGTSMSNKVLLSHIKNYLFKDKFQLEFLYDKTENERWLYLSGVIVFWLVSLFFTKKFLSDEKICEKQK